MKADGNDIAVVVTQTIHEGHATRTSVFEKTFTMPSPILSQAVSSKLTVNGMLEIQVPKKYASTV